MKPHFVLLFYITVTTVILYSSHASGFDIVHLHGGGSRYSRSIKAIVINDLTSLGLLENSSKSHSEFLKDESNIHSQNINSKSQKISIPELEMDTASSSQHQKISHNSRPSQTLENEANSNGLRRLDGSNFPMIPFPPFPPQFGVFRGYNREKHAKSSSSSFPLPTGQVNHRPLTRNRFNYKGSKKTTNNKGDTDTNSHRHRNEYFDNTYSPLSRDSTKNHIGQEEYEKEHPTTSTPFYPSRGIPSPKEFRLPMYSHRRRHQGFSSTLGHDNYVTSRGKEGITNFNNKDYGQSYENLASSGSHGDFGHSAHKESGRGYPLSGNFAYGTHAPHTSAIGNYPSLLPSHIGTGHSPYGGYGSVNLGIGALGDGIDHSSYVEHPGLSGYGIHGSDYSSATNSGNNQGATTTTTSFGLDVDNDVGYGGLAGRDRLFSPAFINAHNSIPRYGQRYNNNNYENSYKNQLTAVNAAALQAVHGITSVDRDASSSSYSRPGLGTTYPYNSLTGYSNFL